MTAAELKKAYNRKYQQEHREELNAYCREWRKANPAKVAAAQIRHWAKVAAEMEGENSNDI